MWQFRPPPQLAEPLNDSDVDRTLDVLRSSEQRVDVPEFQAILDVHKGLPKSTGSERVARNIERQARKQER